MNTIAFGLALAGFLVIFGTIIAYFRTIPRGRVPVKVGGIVLKLSVGILLAILAVICTFRGAGPAEPLVLVPAIFSGVMGSAILWLLSQRKIPKGDLQVKVGDKLLPFASTSSDGMSFNSQDLLGKRTLFKFFRGGWCPYCSAELQSFNGLLPDLEKYDVNVVALSKDSVADAAIHKARDHLNFSLLSDPNLDVIKQFGVEHHKALGQSQNTKTLVGGIPFGLSPFSFKTMAIPTSLLVDEDGIIQWIDQTDDYRLRSNAERVMGAVKSAFG